MSAIVMLFYWVLFPWVVYKVSKLLWRRMPNRFFKGIVIGVTIGIYAWFLWIAVGRNIWLDHQVRRMCAQDGGVKVYETVELTPDLIDKAGRINIPNKEDVKPLDKYYIETHKFYFRTGNPLMYRKHSRIVRQSDGKTLGERISYHRSGGDLPGPWYGSGFSCPDVKERTKFGLSIFIKRS